MNSLKLVKKNPFEFYIQGEIKINVRQSLYKDIDGKRYEHTYIEEKHLKFDKNTQYNKFKINELVEFGIKEITIYYPNITEYFGMGFNYFIENICEYQHSTNQYVNLYLNLKELKIINNKYIDFITYKTSEKSINYKNDIFDYKKIYFWLYHYGYNNELYFIVDIKYLYQIKYWEFTGKNKNTLKNLSDKYPDIFPKKMLTEKLTDIELNKCLISLFEQSNKYKQLNK